MESNIINDTLLDAFKEGTVSKKGIQIRTRFRLNTQNVIDAIETLLTKEIKQLTEIEINTLREMQHRLKTIQGE